MNSSFVATVVLTAAVLTAGCSDGGSQPSGEAMPAPMASPEAGPAASDQGEPADPAFAAFDRNGDGIIDEDEWENREARSVVELKNRTFQQVDRDQSGGLDPEEFAAARVDGGATPYADGGVRDTETDPDATGL